MDIISHGLWGGVALGRMKIKYSQIGICGLSCRLCPHYHTEGASKCDGCKTASRMVVGCPFITCAIKKKGIEFCFDCEENKICIKLKKHREAGKKHDSFKCYQKLEADIGFIQKNGVAEFEKFQKIRERLLKEMLREFNDGRSKSYFCIVATVFTIEELKEALTEAKAKSKGLEIKEKARLFRFILDEIAKQKKYYLKLRK